MEKNLHATAIPPEQVEELMTLCHRMQEILVKYAIPLTAQDRLELLIMGNKTMSFVEDSLKFAKENSDLCPDFFNLEDFEIDMADAVGLRVLRNNLKQSYEIVDDIILISGSEAYQAALTFYGYVKFLANKDIPRAKTIYDALKPRFPGRKRKKDDGTDEVK
jgi:hypothetical protein